MSAEEDKDAPVFFGKKKKISMKMHLASTWPPANTFMRKKIPKGSKHLRNT